MSAQLHRRASLYDVLALRPPARAPAGETVITRQKETLDNDEEALEPDVDGRAGGRLLYELLSEHAAAGSTRGETNLTKKTETLDEAGSDHYDDVTGA